MFDDKLKKRFWAKVNKKGPKPGKDKPCKGNCWEWTAYAPHSYGLFTLANKTILAHRLSYALYIGREIASEEFVCHNCDNPKCVRPGHLYLGNATDNNRDMRKRQKKDKRKGFPRALSEEERFWVRVQKTKNPNDCWNWLGYTRSNGYGCFRNKQAHRLAYEYAIGPIPEKKVLMHTCDNRRCCNPAHLKVGTQKENVHDMLNKERSKTAKLTAKQVHQIWQMYSEGMLSGEIASKIGIGKGAVRDIANGNTWAHLGLPPLPMNIPKGENHGSSQLTEKQVLLIHKLAITVPTFKLAERFGVKLRAIWDILSGHSWKHLKLPIIPVETLPNLTIDGHKKRLTDAEVFEIYGLANIMTQRQMAKIYDVSEAAISHIFSGETYKHLKLKPIKTYASNAMPDEKVLEIYNTANNFDTKRELAKHFDLAESVIHNILTGKTYKHLKLKPKP